MSYQFEEYLYQQIQQDYPCRVQEAMEYSLMGPGKRVRPRLLFAALAGYGLDESAGYPAAAAIEMVHTYSLIHDDLPAMDNDDLRRGRATCHKKYDEATAILAGDGLLTKAFSQILKSQASPEAKNKMVQYLSEFAGSEGMILGQDLDMASQSRNVDAALLQDIHLYKTARLIQLPLVCAAILAGHEEDIDAWMEIGKALGLQFQIQDDILDATSSSAELGKSNSDARNDKLTAVSVMGLEQAKKAVLEYEKTLQEQISRLNIDPKPMEAMFDVLLKRKK